MGLLIKIICWNIWDNYIMKILALFPKHGKQDTYARRCAKDPKFYG